MGYEKLKSAMSRVPLVGNSLRRMYWRLRERRRTAKDTFASTEYWEKRYASGGNSGVGSYNQFARFKADVINRIVREHGIGRVIEFGCGDGNQASLITCGRYLGFDVSETVVRACRQEFSDDPTREFKLVGEYSGERAELALSLDVIYHLVEDKVFENYMRRLFSAADRFVIIYSSDHEDISGRDGRHVRHRCFSAWVTVNCPGWKLIEKIDNRYPYRGDYTTGSFSDFYIFENCQTG